MAVSVGVLLLEAFAATGLIDFRRVRTALAGAGQGWSEDVFVDDHDLSYRRPPHVHKSGQPRSDMAVAFNLPVRASYVQTFSTDGKGFRNAADLDRADIALIGDSYIEGSYVSDNETAAVRLQEQLGRPVENLGVAGYGSLQELKVLEKYALPLHPTLVVWFFFEGNDLDDDQIFENAMVYESMPHAPQGAPARRPVQRWWRDFTARSLTVNAYRELRRWSYRVAPSDIDTFGWFRDHEGVARKMYFYDFYATRTLGQYEEERFEVTKSAFLRGAELSRQHGVRLVVAYIPIKFRVYGDLCTYASGSPCRAWKPWDLEKEFAAFCRAAGIEFLSLAEPMRHAAAAGHVLYAPEDSHWSAEGQRFVADQIATFVSRPPSP